MKRVFLILISLIILSVIAVSIDAAIDDYITEVECYDCESIECEYDPDNPRGRDPDSGTGGHCPECCYCDQSTNHCAPMEDGTKCGLIPDGRCVDEENCEGRRTACITDETGTCCALWDDPAECLGVECGKFCNPAVIDMTIDNFEMFDCKTYRKKCDAGGFCELTQEVILGELCNEDKDCDDPYCERNVDVHNFCGGNAPAVTTPDEGVQRQVCSVGNCIDPPHKYTSCAQGGFDTECRKCDDGAVSCENNDVTYPWECYCHQYSSPFVVTIDYLCVQMRWKCEGGHGSLLPHPNLGGWTFVGGVCSSSADCLPGGDPGGGPGGGPFPDGGDGPYLFFWCGNEQIELGENCDGSNWGPITGCSDFDEYTGGTLTCNAPGSAQECKFNTSLCTGGDSSGFCGDSDINNGDEECDGSDWGPILGCQNFDSWTGGTLSCDSNCNFNTSSCIGTNNCPIMNSVILTDPIYIGTNVYAKSIGWSDTDYTGIGQYWYRWYKNGDLIGEATTGPAHVYPGTKQRGDTITVKVRPYDGQCYGNEVTDTSIVLNSPPTVNVTNNGPKTECIATFTLTADAEDDDGDSLQYRWDFESDGIFDTTWNSSNSVTHAYSANGEPYRDYLATVEVNDGLDITSEDTVVVIDCDPTTLPCDAVENLTAVLKDDLETIRLEWDIPTPNNITAIKICYSDDITKDTDLSHSTRDFYCEWMTTPLSSSATSWEDTNAVQYPKKFYKVKTICSIAGFYPINHTNETVGKIEIPIYKVEKDSMQINDRFSVPLMPNNTNIYDALKSMGKGRGLQNSVFTYDSCTMDDFVGNYSNVWEWDIEEYFATGRDSAAATRFYKSDVLCPYYLSPVYDLKHIQLGRYYEILVSKNETLVNVGKVTPYFTKQLYSGVEPFEIRRSPFGSTYTYNISVPDALSEVGLGQGVENENPDYQIWDTCTGDAADNFVGNYTDLRTFDGESGEWLIYVPGLPCPHYTLTDIYKLYQIVPGEAYLINMTEDEILSFEHGR
jgi:hypothetical protein